jgi:type 1 glutamine amidotransferase
MRSKLAAFVLTLFAAPLLAQQIPPQPPGVPPQTQVGQPPAPTPAQPTCGGRSSNPRTACQPDVDKMMAALPDKAPAKPLRPRKVLVLNHAAGFVHSSIPLAGLTMEAMGKKTGAYAATITWDAADINTENLKQYDLVFLNNTTGCFLDDPNDAGATAARKAALLAFIRGGKGIAGIHAASDSYHGSACSSPMASAGDALWPEFNTLIGGYFKFHWNNPQLITVKIDDPKSPLTAMFHGDFDIHDETYVLANDSFSRANVHVLTSVNYDKMSDADKAKERNPRPDHDYALSWIRAEGNGRLFYEAHGHDESIYAIRPMLEHLLAGVQYALGDLKADDKPVK